MLKTYSECLLNVETVTLILIKTRNIKVEGSDYLCEGFRPSKYLPV